MVVAMSGRRLKVLIADDSRTNLVLLEHLLAQEDCDVFSASNWQEAVDLVYDHRFALILLDIQMPEVDGYEAARAIKALSNGRHVPIIFITAIFQNEGNVEQGYDAGAVDYLFRPVNVRTLKSKIRIFLQMHRQNMLLHHEIEQRKKAEAALRKAEEQFRSIFERAVEGIFQARLDGTFTEVNPALVRILGFDSAEQVLAVPAFGRTMMVNEEQAEHYIRNLRRDGYVSNFEFQARVNDGSIVWLSTSNRLVYDDDGEEFGVEGVVEDITRRKNHEFELNHLATVDSLTGIPNRHVFHDRVEHAIEAARRFGTRLAVLFMDLDEFKKVNDLHGHGTGDRLLQMLAERCRKRVRAADTFARIGGDEFGVLLERIESDGNASEVAETILESLETPFFINGVRLLVGATIGISLFPGDGEDAQSLLKVADSAMYASKGDLEVKYAFHARVQ